MIELVFQITYIFKILLNFTINDVFLKIDFLKLLNNGVKGKWLVYYEKKYSYSCLKFYLQL